LSYGNEIVTFLVSITALAKKQVDGRLRDHRFGIVLAIAVLTLALGQGCRRNSAAGQPQIREVSVGGHRYAAADVFLSRSTLELCWKKQDGSRIGTFRNLDAYLAASGKRLLFATNAGIFDANNTPLGLFVADRQTLAPLNLNSGSGNFFLQPNGIFLIDADGAAIIESSAYSKRTTLPRLATQSGPLLVINGQINPQLSADSNSRKIRSGVGVISADQIVFALSRDRVTFFEFASLLRDDLHCQNALYLDGEISRFYPDPTGSDEQQQNFAGMFAVTDRK
jgi:uncharacterized protein YigE (DUF2233 family)